MTECLSVFYAVVWGISTDKLQSFSFAQMSMF